MQKPGQLAKRSHDKQVRSRDKQVRSHDAPR